MASQAWHQEKLRLVNQWWGCLFWEKDSLQPIFSNISIFSDMFSGFCTNLYQSSNKNYGAFGGSFYCSGDLEFGSKVSNTIVHTNLPQDFDGTGPRTKKKYTRRLHALSLLHTLSLSHTLSHTICLSLSHKITLRGSLTSLGGSNSTS